jgi:hypothetical protein
MLLANFSVGIGILAFAIGILLLLNPGTLKKINEASTKIVVRLDNYAFSYRVGVGISLLIASAFLLLMAYYISKRY